MYPKPLLLAPNRMGFPGLSPNIDSTALGGRGEAPLYSIGDLGSSGSSRKTNQRYWHDMAIYTWAYKKKLYFLEDLSPKLRLYIQKRKEALLIFRDLEHSNLFSE